MMSTNNIAVTVKASVFSPEFLNFVRATFPELFEKFNNGDKQAEENIKYLNFGYQLKECQRRALEDKILRIQIFASCVKFNKVYNFADKEEIEEIYYAKKWAI